VAGDEQRRQLKSARRVVVKLGTRVLSSDGGGVSHERLAGLAAEAEALRERGVELVVVTSGAIGAGAAALGLPRRPTDIPTEQAAASVGQGLLMHAYASAFGARGITVGQVLLTQSDLRDRQRYINARNALEALLARGVVPVVNENDAVAVDELQFGSRFGDNDTLSALVASLVGADVLVILTDQEGLLSSDPKVAADAQRISLVTDIDAVESLAGGAGHEHAKGGMETKIKAARVVTSCGIPLVITEGRRAESPVISVLSGEDVGTLFAPSEGRLSARRRWMAFALEARGRLVVDAGAARALRDGKKSLLPSGVLSAEGVFQGGDMVTVVTESGEEIGRGITSYSSDEVARIAGAKTSEIETILGYKYRDEVIHRDDLAVSD